MIEQQSQLSFGEALDWIKEGCTVARSAWAETDYLIFDNGHIKQVSSDYTIEFLGISEDLLADDWYVREDNDE